MKTFIITLILLIALFVGISPVQAQVKDEKYAIELLDKAMGKIGEESNYAIHFEGIAYGLSNPKDIFTLPAYKIYRGGYLYNDGKKFEIQLGLMKAICDGKLMVMIDESSKTMVIDSLRDKVPGGYTEVPDIQKLIDENFGEGKLVYAGTEKVNGKECHKLKAEYKDAANSHVYYWVDAAKETLLLMAEYQGESYDVYWVKQIGKAPKGYNYEVKVPKKELETLYGYEVFDFRYTSRELQPVNR